MINERLPVLLWLQLTFLYNIPRVAARYHASALPAPPIYHFENEVRNRLIGEGLQEFLTCDLIGPSVLELVEEQFSPPESLIQVLNPTSIEQSILRTSLLPGLLQVVKHNIDRQNHRIAGFEIGRVHFKEKEQYKEQPVAAILLTGPAHLDHWEVRKRNFDFFDLKGIVENVLAVLGIENAMFKKHWVEDISFRAASLCICQFPRARLLWRNPPQNPASIGCVSTDPIWGIQFTRSLTTGETVGKSGTACHLPSF